MSTRQAETPRQKHTQRHTRRLARLQSTHLRLYCAFSCPLWCLVLVTLNQNTTHILASQVRQVVLAAYLGSTEPRFLTGLRLNCSPSTAIYHKPFEAYESIQISRSMQLIEDWEHNNLMGEIIQATRTTSVPKVSSRWKNHKLHASTMDSCVLAEFYGTTSHFSYMFTIRLWLREKLSILFAEIPRHAAEASEDENLRASGRQSFNIPLIVPSLSCCIR